MTSGRVVITGLGAVTPVGIGVKPFWQALRDGVPGIDRITLFDANPYPCQVGAEVHGFEPREYMSPKAAVTRMRFVQFGVAAARMAYDDAGLFSVRRASRFAVCFGSSANGGVELQDSIGDFAQEGPRRFSPSVMMESAGHAAAGHVATELGLAGQTMSVTTGCVTGLDVVQWAYHQIQTGQVAGVVAGAAEAPLIGYIHAAWCGLGLLTHWSGPPAQALRPFDALRDGTTLGEGAGAFVLEDLDHARARGARLYAEVLGFGSGTEGHKRAVEPTGAAFQAAVRGALRMAGLGTGDIDYINAHASGSVEHDRAESAAYQAVFGEQAYGIPVSSIKPMIGQSMGAAGALQVVAGCFALEEQFIPPTLNLDLPDPACDLDYVPGHGRVARVNRLVIAARALGGTRSALVLGRPPAA